jgi:hypothetical protein
VWELALLGNDYVTYDRRPAGRAGARTISDQIKFAFAALLCLIGSICLDLLAGVLAGAM